MRQATIRCGARRLSLGAATLLLLTSVPSARAAESAPAGSSAASAAARIDARAAQYVEAGLFSGVVLVSKGDGVLYERAFGLADRTFDVPNTLSTSFHLASVSKPITAAAVLLLADRGKLALTAPVSRILPDFPSGSRITIDDVLTHYSGLGDTSTGADYSDWSRSPQTPASLVERLAKKPPVGEPGKAFRYSNSNYHLLALIIEKVSGQRYGEYLATEIFTPLQMMGSGHHGDVQAIVPRLATGYMPKGVDEFEKPAFFDWSSKTGNGSLYATARDLLKFHRALQNGGLLKPETVAASHGFGRTDREVGAFWFRRERGGHRSVYVGGSSPGFKAHLERFVDDDVAVIVLSNLYIASSSVIASDIAAILWGTEETLPPVPRRVRRPREELDRVTGTYRFASDFFTPGLLVRVERRDDYLVEIPAGTDKGIPLVPIGTNRYFDRLYWSFVRFEDGKLVYTNGGKDYVAAAQK